MSWSASAAKVGVRTWLLLVAIGATDLLTLCDGHEGERRRLERRKQASRPRYRDLFSAKIDEDELTMYKEGFAYLSEHQKRQATRCWRSSNVDGECFEGRQSSEAERGGRGGRCISRVEALDEE